jgi:phage-related protein
MVRPQSVPGDKPLFWVGSAKNDLMEFPEAVKDEIGTVLSVAQFGGMASTRRRSRGRAKGRASWRSSRTTAAIFTACCTQ